MKVVAHPLVVAAALGLLGPEALEGFEEKEPTCARCPSDEVDAEALGASLGQLDETLFTVDARDGLALGGSAPSAEDIARVESAWKSLS